MNHNGVQLIKLAQKRHKSKLSPLEKRILLCAGKGEACNCLANKNPKKQVVCPHFLKWICSDNSARHYIHNIGMIIHNALFTEEFHFLYVTTTFPIFFSSCTFEKDIIFLYSTFKSIFFINSNCKNINADGTTIENMFKADDSSILGTLSIPDAKIGSVTLSNTRIISNKSKENRGISILADGASIKNSFRLENSFFSEGAIRLLGVSIGGFLSTATAHIKAPTTGISEGIAVHADGIKTAHHVSLGNNFTSDGEIRLLSGKINGDLDFTKSRLMPNPNTGFSISADGATINGRLCLDYTDSKGTIRFQNAEINTDLSINKSTLRSVNSGFAPNTSFVGQNCKVHGNLVLTSSTIDGEFNVEYSTTKGVLILKDCDWSEKSFLNLSHASTGYLLDNHNGWPTHKNFALDNFKYTGFFEVSTYNSKQRLLWIQKSHNPIKFSRQPYEQLAKVLREAGHEADAKKVCIERRKALARTWRWLPVFRSQPKTRWRPHQKLWDLLARYSIGYGYQTWRPAVGMLGMIILGCFLFGFANSNSNLMKFQQSSILQSGTEAATFATEPYPEFSTLWYTVDTFIPLIDLHQEAFYLPDVTKGDDRWFALWSMKTGAWLRHYLSFHIISGWILTSLFVVGLTGVMRKDE